MALWTPEYIDTALWLDAADSETVTLDAGAVSQWADKSGNGRIFAQATSALRPGATTLGDKTALSFAGDYLTSSDAASVWTFLHDGTLYSAFLVVSAGVISDPNTAYTLLGNNGLSSARHGIGIFWDDRASVPRNEKIVCLVTKGGTPSPIDASGNDGFWPPIEAGILGFAFDPANATPSARLAIRRNGDTPVTSNTTDGIVNTAAPQWTLQLGASGAGGFPLSGVIAEVLIVQGALADDTRQKIEGYLAHKWVLATYLQNDHPYKSAAPAVASISGTITDSAGNPCQRKVYAVSRPTDATAPIILAHGLSDPTTGAYELSLLAADEVTRVVISEDDDPLTNDIVDRVIPE